MYHWQHAPSKHTCAIKHCEYQDNIRRVQDLISSYNTAIAMSVGGMSLHVHMSTKGIHGA